MYSLSLERQNLREIGTVFRPLERDSGMRVATFWFGLVLLISSVVKAENWTHWRGPTGNGVALNAHPPTEWGP